MEAAARFEPVHPEVGAEVTGARFDAAIADSVLEAILDALARLGVLVFRNAHPSPAEQVAFMRRFCDMRDGHGIEALLPGHPHVAVLSNVVENGRAIGYQNHFGVEWHSDGTGWRRDTLATSLHCIETPDTGGDTLFVNGRRAYGSLDADLRRRVDDARVVYSRPWLLDKLARAAGRAPIAPAERARFPEVIRPLAPSHPRDGERALVFSIEEARIVDDLDEATSRGFLEELLQHATGPGHVYRHRWRPGDVLVWDNRTVMHSPTEYTYADARRRLHRVIGLVPDHTGG